MDIILPYKDFLISALVLDTKRLDIQRGICLQVIERLKTPNMTFSKNIVFRLWENYEEAIKLYYNVLNCVWIRKGYKNTMPFLKYDKNLEFPWWLGDREIHDYYKQYLLNKDYLRYSRIFKNISP